MAPPPPKPILKAKEKFDAVVNDVRRTNSTYRTNRIVAPRYPPNANLTNSSGFALRRRSSTASDVSEVRPLPTPLPAVRWVSVGSVSGKGSKGGNLGAGLVTLGGQTGGQANTQERKGSVASMSSVGSAESSPK